MKIIVPYSYVMDAEDEDEAEEKAWKMFEEDIDDWHNPPLVESIEEMTADGEAQSPQQGNVTNGTATEPQSAPVEIRENLLDWRPT